MSKKALIMICFMQWLAIFPDDVNKIIDEKGTKELLYGNVLYNEDNRKVTFQDGRSLPIPKETKISVTKKPINWPPPSNPEIKLFNPDKIKIGEGDKIKLSWEVKDIASIKIEPNVGGDLKVPKGETQELTLLSTTKYKLIALDKNGKPLSKPEPKETTIDVVPNPIIEEFKVSNPAIVKNKTATISWKVKHASSVSIDNSIGVVAADGKDKLVSPDKDTTYILTATNGLGKSVTSSVSLRVVTPVEIEYFNPLSSSIKKGNSTELSWKVKNATSITIDNSLGDVSLEGKKTINPDKNITYILTAKNELESKTASISIIVQEEVCEWKKFSERVSEPKTTGDHHCSRNCRDQPTRTNYQIQLNAPAPSKPNRLRKLENSLLQCTSGNLCAFSEIKIQPIISPDKLSAKASFDVWTRPTTWILSADYYEYECVLR